MARPGPGETSQRDQIIELMFSLLPASNVDEILDGIQGEMPEVIKQGVTRAIGHLRKHPKKYGWTIPHVGGNSNHQKDRYFALLVERDGTYYFDENPESIGHLHDGTKSIVTRIATESQNQAAMLRIAATHFRRRNKREELLDLAMDTEYLARKARGVARTIDEGEAA